MAGKTPREFVRAYGLSLPKTDASNVFDFTVTVVSLKHDDFLKERLIEQEFQHNKNEGNWFMREYGNWCRIGLDIVAVRDRAIGSKEKSFSNALSASYQAQLSVVPDLIIPIAKSERVIGLH